MGVCHSLVRACIGFDISHSLRGDLSFFSLHRTSVYLTPLGTAGTDQCKHHRDELCDFWGAESDSSCCRA
jgi:hypothetical protein